MEKALQRCYFSFGNVFIVKIVGNVFIVIYSFFLSRHTDIKVRSNKLLLALLLVLKLLAEEIASDLPNFGFRNQPYIELEEAGYLFSESRTLDDCNANCGTG